jgi:hypothetical protein
MNHDYNTDLGDKWARNCRKLIPRLSAELLYGITNKDVDSVSAVVWHPISSINIISVFNHDSGISQIVPLSPFGIDD